MSKELAERLEQLAVHLKGTVYLHPEHVTALDEAIAALRSEPVAWQKDRVFDYATKKYIEVDAAPAREDQRESSEGRTEGSQSLGSNPAPTSGQSKTGLTESHSGAPTREADELLRASSNVRADILKWHSSGERPDEWKLREWADMLTAGDDYLSRKEHCVVNPVMSCVCNRGTKSCIVSHPKEPK